MQKFPIVVKTCNTVRSGQLVYIFSGYGKDYTQTNRVHVYDTTSRTWSEPEMRGTLPVPRDSHSCTTIGDKLFVFKDDLRRKRVVVDSGNQGPEHGMMDSTLQMQGATSAASDMKTPAASNPSLPHEVSGGRRSPREFNMTNASCAAEDSVNSIPNQDGQSQSLTAEELGLLIKSPAHKV